MIIDDIIARESERSGLDEEQETILMDWLYQSAERSVSIVSLEVRNGCISIISSVSPINTLDELIK